MGTMRGTDNHYNDSSLPKLAICILTFNSARTIKFVLRSTLNQHYPINRIVFILVDGGSKDDTVLTARNMLSQLGASFVIKIAEGANIPSARNIAVQLAYEEGANAVVFIDSDVIFTDGKVLRDLIDNMVEVNGIVSIPYKYADFHNWEEAGRFCEDLLSSGAGEHKERMRHVVSWTAMGATTIPMELATKLKFRENLSFDEDSWYCYNAWLHGYGVYSLESSGYSAYDINMQYSGNIFQRMTYKQYFSGLKDKVLAHYIFPRYLTAQNTVGVITKVEGLHRSFLYHNASLAVVILGLIAIFFGFSPLILVAYTPFLAVYLVVKSRDGLSIKSSLKHYPKFFIFAAILPFVIMYVLGKEGENLNRAKASWQEMKREELRKPSLC